MRNDVLFERFVSAQRQEPPDIDVDFEHERREEVIQWVYRTYGQNRAALAATVIRYRARYAVREVGKVLGLPEDLTGELARMTWAWDAEGVTEERVKELGLTLEDRRLRLTLELTRQLMGTPRHFGQHPGGFILTLDRLDDLVPIEPATMADRQIVEWDKDDLDALGFMKVDVLGPRHARLPAPLLRSPGRAQGDAARPRPDPAGRPGRLRHDLRSRHDRRVPDREPGADVDAAAPEAPEPRRPDDRGRRGPAGADPGRHGPPLPAPPRGAARKYVPPTEEFDRVLGKTLGVPLFQEQAMSVAIHCAGFTADEADQLRRAMATFKHTGGVSHFREQARRRHDRARLRRRDFAVHTVKQLEGFGSYGFPMSHAASFAILAYASSWMKHHHPDVFLAALLNSQPMGFYAPAQLVSCARRHGVEVRPVCVNRSGWDCTLEPCAASTGGFAVRLGLADGQGPREQGRREARRGARPTGRSPSVEELQRRTGLGVGALERLAAADAFHALGLARRDAVWAIRALRDTALPLFAAAEADRGAGRGPEARHRRPRGGGGLRVRRPQPEGAPARLPAPGPRPPRRHAGGRARGACSDGQRVKVAGLVLVRQRPGSAKGVMFVTLEDETGPLNVIVWPSLFERFRRTVFSAGMMGVAGKLQREVSVIHVVAERLVDLSAGAAQRWASAAPRSRCRRAAATRRAPAAASTSAARTKPPLGLSAARHLHPRPAAPPRPEGIRVRPRNFR